MGIQQQNTTDFSSVVFCLKGCLFGCYYFTANFARPSAELFVFARIILSIVGVDVLGDPNERQPNGTPGRSSPTKSGRAVQFVENPAVLFTF